MIKNIVTNLKVLRVPLLKQAISKKEQDNIVKDLSETLISKKGIGLSSNQIGYDKRICLINVIEPIFLVNPEIINASSDTILYAEGCLSLPKTLKKNIIVNRFFEITVKADNYEKPLTFKPSIKKSESGKYIYSTKNEFFNDIKLLECICIQHEIDHLNGITILDTRFYKPRIVDKKYGRNDKVMIENSDTGETDFIKYKKAEPLLEVGWVIV